MHPLSFASVLYVVPQKKLSDMKLKREKLSCQKTNN